MNKLLISVLVSATVCLGAVFPVFAQTTANPAAAAPTPKVFSEWLKKKSFEVKFRPANFGNVLTYKVYPGDGQNGYTNFYGWNDSCAAGDVPTSFSVNDEGKMVMTFTPKLRGCETFRYEFDPAKGPVGEIYLKTGEAWVLRPSTAELVGYDVAEYQRALAEAGKQACVAGDTACELKKAVQSPALGVIK